MIVYSEDIVIAKWQDRFFAWFVDFVIVYVVIGTVIGVANHFNDVNFGWYATTSLFFLGYWMILEYFSGQSLGKKIFCLKTIKIDGSKPNLLDCAVNAFGKAFLLPVDVVLGWIFTDKKRQRIFNRLSDTIVIKVQRYENEEISYHLD